MFAQLAKSVILALLCAAGAQAGMKGGTGIPTLDQASAQKLGSAIIEKKVGGLLFDPSHPAAVSYQDDEVSLRLDSGGPGLAVVAQVIGQPVKRIPLPDIIKQVNEIRRAPANHAVVLGMLGGSTWAVAVLDTLNSRVIDTFWGDMPAISPGGRYVAFIKFFPPHGTEGADDHYMLYDLVRTPSQNRPSGVNASEEVSVGMTVYPPGMGNKPFDNENVPEKEIHMVASDDFFWSPNSDQFLFADKYQGSLSLIKIRVGMTGPPKVSIANIPQDELCASRHKKTCEVHLAAVDFGAQTVTAHFRGVGTDGSLRKDFDYGDQQFSAVN